MTPSDGDDERAPETGADAAAGADPAPETPDDAAAREAAAWQAIVDNYGDHPAFEHPAAPEEPPTAETPRPGARRLDLDDAPGAVVDRSGDHTQDRAQDRAQDPVVDDPEDHYVPPPPPRVPLASPPRLLAWIGLFGVPLLTLVAIVAGASIPQWLSVLFMAWFVGGFAFLVASMRSGPRDGHDDGAVL
ncbi:hypothetical protein [Nocardioides aurantiacus]|uniref:hypothetical protein n=1 Tax=Nocardioides aurantiacus TaxID=86796 RepID=UPI00403F17CD